MQGFIFKRFIFLMALNAFSATQVWSTNDLLPQDINSSLHKIGQAIHQKLAKDESFIFCPLGVAQTLTALHGMVEKSLQDEIENFASNSNIVRKVENLNQLLRNLSSATSTREDQKFALINNNYAIFTDYLDVKPETEEKFKVFRINPLIVNFKKADEIAQMINNIVKHDTQDKTIKLLSPNCFSFDAFILLHTLNVKDQWKMHNVDECRLDFQDQNNLLKKVYGFKVEGQEFQFYQDDNITYLALPTRQDYQVIIRHSQGDVQPVSQLGINALLASQKLYTRFVQVPFVSMKIEHNLKALLGFDLPNVLTKSFLTKLYDESIKVNQYVQKLTFVMNDQGIEASPASRMGRPDRSRLHPSGPEIIIDGPFSFALVKKLENQNLLLLSGQVVDHSVLKTRT